MLLVLIAVAAATVTARRQLVLTVKQNDAGVEKTCHELCMAQRRGRWEIGREKKKESYLPCVNVRGPWELP